MTDGPSLFAHQAVLTSSALDLIISHLMLFAPSVYLNCQVRSEDDEIEIKLRELVDAGLVEPWALPGEKPWRGLWSTRSQLREVSSRQYSQTAEMVRAATAGATGILGQQRALRPIEIVQLSTCAWQSGLAESLESDRVIGPRRSFPSLLAALRRSNYQQNIAQEFLGLVADLPVGLSGLPTAEILSLQSKYRRRMSEWLSAHISSWPAEVNWSTESQTDSALRSLLQAYSIDATDALSKRRRKPASRVTSLALDILGFFFWPAGLVTIAQELGDWFRDHQDFKVEWFLSDLKKAAEVQTSRLAPPEDGDVEALPPA